MKANLFKGGISKLLNLQVGWYILLIQLFVLVNIALFFPQNTDFYRTITIVYLVFNATFFALPDLRSSMFGTPIRQAFPKFFMFFFGTLIILALTGGLLLNPGYFHLNLVNVPFGLIFLQVFVVAFVEESVFRDALATRVGIIGANIAFALFHYVVYQGNLLTMAIAFGAGMLFSYIKIKFGRNVDSTPNIAVHSAINLHLLGVSKLILGGG